MIENNDSYSKKEGEIFENCYKKLLNPLEKLPRLPQYFNDLIEERKKNIVENLLKKYEAIKDLLPKPNEVKEVKIDEFIEKNIIKVTEKERNITFSMCFFLLDKKRNELIGWNKLPNMKFYFPGKKIKINREEKEKEYTQIGYGEWRIPLGEGITGFVYEYKEPINLPDINEDLRQIYSNVDDMLAVKGVMQWPIISKEGIILGVAGLFSPFIQIFEDSNLEYLKQPIDDLAQELYALHMNKALDETIKYSHSLIEYLTLQYSDFCHIIQNTDFINSPLCSIWLLKEKKGNKMRFQFENLHLAFDRLEQVFEEYFTFKKRPPKKNKFVEKIKETIKDDGRDGRTSYNPQDDASKNDQYYDSLIKLLKINHICVKPFKICGSVWGVINVAFDERAGKESHNSCGAKGKCNNNLKKLKNLLGNLYEVLKLKDLKLESGEGLAKYFRRMEYWDTILKIISHKLTLKRLDSELKKREGKLKELKSPFKMREEERIKKIKYYLEIIKERIAFLEYGFEFLSSSPEVSAEEKEVIKKILRMNIVDEIVDNFHQIFTGFNNGFPPPIYYHFGVLERDIVYKEMAINDGAANQLKELYESISSLNISYNLHRGALERFSPIFINSIPEERFRNHSYPNFKLVEEAKIKSIVVVPINKNGEIISIGAYFNSDSINLYEKAKIIEDYIRKNGGMNTQEIIKRLDKETCVLCDFWKMEEIYKLKISYFNRDKIKEILKKEKNEEIELEANDLDSKKCFLINGIRDKFKKTREGMLFDVLGLKNLMHFGIKEKLGSEDYIGVLNVYSSFEDVSWSKNNSKEWKGIFEDENVVNFCRRYAEMISLVHNLYTNELERAVAGILIRNFAHHHGSHVIPRIEKAKNQEVVEYLKYLQGKTALLNAINALPLICEGKVNLKDALMFLFKNEGVKFFLKCFAEASGKEEISVTRIENNNFRNFGNPEEVLVSPGFGELGVHGIYIIFENYVRNLLKHCQPVSKGDDVKFEVKKEDNFAVVKILTNKYIVDKAREKKEIIEKIIAEGQLVDEEGKTNFDNAGLKEMRICANLLAGKRLIALDTPLKVIEDGRTINYEFKIPLAKYVGEDIEKIKKGEEAKPDFLVLPVSKYKEAKENWSFIPQRICWIGKEETLGTDEWVEWVKRRSIFIKEEDWNELKEKSESESESEKKIYSCLLEKWWEKMLSKRKPKIQFCETNKKGTQEGWEDQYVERKYFSNSGSEERKYFSNSGSEMSQEFHFCHGGECCHGNVIKIKFSHTSEYRIYRYLGNKDRWEGNNVNKTEKKIIWNETEKKIIWLEISSILAFKILIIDNELYDKFSQKLEDLEKINIEIKKEDPNGLENLNICDYDCVVFHLAMLEGNKKIYHISPANLPPYVRIVTGRAKGLNEEILKNCLWANSPQIDRSVFLQCDGIEDIFEIKYRFYWGVLK